MGRFLAVLKPVGKQLSEPWSLLEHISAGAHLTLVAVWGSAPFQAFAA